MFKLVLKEGPVPGQEFALDRPELTLGRDPASADIVIASGAVSRKHSKFTRRGEQFFIEDLASANGTFVNGQRVSAPTRLNHGDQIALGQAVVLSFVAPPPSGLSQTPVAPTIVVAMPAAMPAAASYAAPAAPGDMMKTMLGLDIEMPGPSVPPQFTVMVAGADPQTYTLSKARVTIGRAEDNDIVVPSKIASRRQAWLERADGGYQLVVSPEAGNPVLFEGRPLTAPRRLRHDDKLRIGGMDPGTMVTMTYVSPSEAVAGADGGSALAFGEKTRLQIGRHPTNDVVLNAPQVSLYHAVVERVGTRFRVRDLRSSNGTFVNNQRIEGETWLKQQDAIRIGPYRFVMGADRLDQFDETRGLRVDALGLNKWVRKNLNILQNISLVFNPKEFIVVVGQSGGGKSTLVDAIAGYRPATHGKVLVNEIDVYRHFDAVRNDIGFVPQRDIIHMELTVFQALDYAAQMRMPPDTTKEERRKRVEEVLEDLDLVHRKDVQISGLSGGQQKRVSIGVELLTRPGLFFLDEPTSGLDPGTETALMHLMRRLADQGRTIVLITHATKNVMLADKVIFLARGGYLAWFGPPEEALQYFDQFRSERERRATDMEFDQIYAILDDPSKGSPADWAKKYQAHPAFQQYVARPLQSKQAVAGSAAPAAQAQPGRVLGGMGARAVRRQISSVRQFLILSARNIKILTRDRFSLMLMLATAPLVGMLDIGLGILVGRQPFSPGLGGQVEGNVFNVMISLFLLAIYGVMVGALAMMREIVKEQDIYKRERLVNLKILPYVLSKVWVAALLALYQAAAYTIIHYLAFDMPGGLLEFGLVYITLALATMAGMMVGLFASALAPNANAAPLIVILFILPQIVLGGALIPLPGSGQYISGVMSTRWAFEAFVAITGVGSDVAADACWTLPEDERKAMAEESKETTCQCLGTNIFKPGSCNFPGVGRFYEAEVDLPQPQLPPDIGAPPAEPVFEDAPVEPQNPDTVAIAQYFEEFKAWKARVDVQQQAYKDEVADYQARVNVYQETLKTDQEKLVRWQIGRTQAVEPAEGLISQVNRDLGWTFVNKDDTAAYTFKVVKTWAAQLIIITILLVGILILQKRKDVT